MKILYLASVRIPNEKASGLAIMRQCEAFAKNGNDVTLLLPYRSNSIKENPFDYYGIEKIFKVEIMRSLDFFAPLGLLSFLVTRLSQMVVCFARVVIQYKEIDLIYTRDPWLVFFLVVCGAYKKLGLEAHKTYDSYFIDYVSRKVNILVCISKGLMDYYSARTGRNDIMVEPSGVYLKQFQVVSSQEKIRNQLGLPRTKIVIGYIGKYTTMGEGKGVDELIAAFAHVHKINVETHLLIAGLEQKEMEAVRALCREHELRKDDVSLLSLIQKDFATYLQAADILVMNYPDTPHYRHYMSPTKLFAYMASGKLIIASDLPSVREIVDESMVLFVPPGDVNTLTKAILRATKNDVSFESMKKKNLDTVTVFSWEERANRILKLLDRNENSLLSN